MQLSRTASLVLYVPFSNEYTVAFDRISELDTDAFFNECFVEPHLSEDIQKLKALPEDEIGDLEYPLKREELIHKYETEISRRQGFLDWMDGNGDGIYLLRGDAGTGKTTYVHYLKWLYKSVDWKILDLKKARERINVFNYRIKVKDFTSLHRKVISCILDEIADLIFIKKAKDKPAEDKSSEQYDVLKTYKRIQILLDRYESRIQPAEPFGEYGLLYQSLHSVSIHDLSDSISYCRECANIFTKYFMNQCILCNDLSDALECAITHYMIVSRCFAESRRKTIFVFDNLERFIGVHEIYSNEIIAFISNLRGIVDSYKIDYIDSVANKNRFAENFQLIVAMRNTSVRSFTPQQNADFFEGSVDLSEWFSLGEIITNKLQWYKGKNYTVENGESLMYIMKDFGIAEDGVVRGLRPKLNFIFNYNKRLTIEFLVEILESASNEKSLVIADELRTTRFNRDSKNRGLSAFAYRSIIWRLLIDKLNRGGMFRYVFSKRHTKEDSYTDLDYIRNILTILSNFAIVADDDYMPLEEMVQTLYHISGDPAMWFDNWTCETERSKVAQLLYYMNYYNRRENNWFQLVDIQCNDASYDKYHFEKWEDFLEMIKTKNQTGRRIAVRITNAGKAYIGYIVQTFEFISALEGISMPLLCCLPTETDLQNTDIDLLPCIQIINQVAQATKHYIQDDDPQIKYERIDRDLSYSYTNRIVNSHVGYLDNFCECIERTIISDDADLVEKKNILINRIKEVTETYRALTRGSP